MADQILSVLYPLLFILILSALYARGISFKREYKAMTSYDRDAVMIRADAWERTDRINEAQRCKPCPRDYTCTETLQGNPMTVVSVIDRQKRFRAVWRNNK